MTLMESGEDIARPQRLYFEGIIHRGLGLAVGGRLIVYVYIVLGKMVIRVRNHVIWYRLLVNWFRLLINRVRLLVRMGRGLIVVIRRR